MITEAGPISISIRRDRGGGDAIDMYARVAPIGSFNCIDGSVFIQELNNNSNNNDNLTLTLHKNDGKRFRLPPLIHHIPLKRFTSKDQLKSYVLMKSRDSLYITWIGHTYTYGRTIQAGRRTMEADAARHPHTAARTQLGTMEAAAARRRPTAARNQLVNSFQALNLNGGL